MAKLLRAQSLCISYAAAAAADDGDDDNDTVFQGSVLADLCTLINYAKHSAYQRQ